MSKDQIEQSINQVKILLDSTSKKELAKQHRCTPQTVRQSLKYVINSKKAIAIRMSAKQILINQASKI